MGISSAKNQQSMTKTKAVLGIDNGTQGLTVLLVSIEDPSLPILATGEGTYECIHGLPEGCYEQRASDWEDALMKAIDQIRPQMEQHDVVAIGISGQMHGQVLVDTKRHGDHQAVGNVRLWCDSRNQTEVEEISEWFGMTTPLPKRITVARWLWTLRCELELAQETNFITTPAGWLSYILTDNPSLGIGDASGMFPMGSTDYRSDLLEIFDTKIALEFPNITPFSKLLPNVRSCGQDAGSVTSKAAKRFGLPADIPVAPAEGDQPASLVGSLIARAGIASVSFGTSVCANLVGEDSFSSSKIESPLVNHFSAVNGQPIYMVWLRNGTTFFNSQVQAHGGDFSKIMPMVLNAPIDCEGLISLPFMDDEPGLGIHQGGTAMTIGWNPSNTQDAGCACKAALLATMFNLLQGTDFLRSRSADTVEILLSGGLTKTPESGQILADVFNKPVRLLEGSEEGCSLGAAVLAQYRYVCSQQGQVPYWQEFLSSIPPRSSRTFQPNLDAVPVYREMYFKYLKLLGLQTQLQNVVSSSS